MKIILYIFLNSCCFLNLHAQSEKPLWTRLDSLQGTWADEQDSLNKIKIFNSYRLAIYDNTARLQDTLRFYLADACVSTMEELTNAGLTSGSYINLFVSNKRFLCHKIDYLTKDEFCYISGGHLACFKRCADFALPKQ